MTGRSARDDASCLMRAGGVVPQENTPDNLREVFRVLKVLRDSAFIPKRMDRE